MSEPVNVTITESPLVVTVTDETPTVTVTDNETSVITVIDAVPTVSVQADQAPLVVVNTGAGASYDSNTVLGMLAGQLTDEHMSVSLISDLDHSRDLWTRVGNEIIMLQEDGAALLTTATTYTDTQITSTAANISVVDGRVDANVSTIIQQAALLDSHVLHFTSVDEAISLQDTRITQTESNIASTVTRLDGLDGPGGAIELHQTSIDQIDSRVTIEALRIDQNEDDIITNSASLQVTDDSLTSYVTQLNSIDGLLSSVSVELTATSATTNITAINQANTAISLTAVETMLANHWGVTISEDANDYVYATGLGLILHPVWVVNTVYEIDDYISFNDSGVTTIYQCILGHTASTANNPVSGAAATYWVEDADGKKSEFAIHAEQFKIYNVDTAFPMFTVNGNAVTLGYDIALQSSNYVTDTSGYKIDPVTGTVEFNQMTLTLNWSDVIDDNGSMPDNNATVGATWDSNIISQPADALLLNNLQEWDDVQDSSSTKPDNNADVTGDNTANDTANVGGTAATTVRDNAANALSATEAMAADGVLSVQEKTVWRVQWPGMLANYTSIFAQATSYGIQTETVFVTFTTEKDALLDYLTDDLDVWSDPTNDTVISPDTLLTTNVENFYEAMTDAVNAIADASTQDGIDSGIETDTGGITVRNTTTGDYAHLTDGDLNFYYWDGSSHLLYQSVNRIESGYANIPSGGKTITVPGLFRTMPKVQLSSAYAMVYDSTNDSSTQEIKLVASNYNLTTGGVFSFDAEQELLVYNTSYEGTLSQGGATVPTVSDTIVYTDAVSSSVNIFFTSYFYMRVSKQINYTIYNYSYRAVVEVYEDGSWKEVISIDSVLKYNINGVPTGSIIDDYYAGVALRNYQAAVGSSFTSVRYVIKDLTQISTYTHTVSHSSDIFLWGGSSGSARADLDYTSHGNPTILSGGGEVNWLVIGQ